MRAVLNFMGEDIKVSDTDDIATIKKEIEASHGIPTKIQDIAIINKMVILFIIKESKTHSLSSAEEYLLEYGCPKEVNTQAKDLLPFLGKKSYKKSIFFENIDSLDNIEDTVNSMAEDRKKLIIQNINEYVDAFFKK